jgi:putative flippase GtrA
MELFNKHKLMVSKFILVGTIGFICNYLALKIFTHFHINSIVSEIIAAAIALQITFLLHDNWTYRINKEKNHLHNLRTRYLSYLTSNSVGSIMTVLLFSVFSLVINHFEALLCAASLSMVWNFLMNKTMIWRQKLDG